MELCRTCDFVDIGVGMVKIVVIGSCMIDLSCYTSRLPKPGETLMGHKFILGHGGKGANQCVSAARLGAKTALIARLGDDSFGLDYQKILAHEKINIQHVAITEDCSSGMAQITVADNGENQIVIVSGANEHLSPGDVVQAKELVQKAEVLVFQLETPIKTTIEAMKFNKGRAKCIVNGAPAIPNPDPDLYKLCDVFCVNESEAELMSGIPVNSTKDAGKAISNFLAKGCRSVIITMGSNGAVFATKESPTPIHVPTKKVKPVDTTGAGDSFIGALAYYLAYHTELTLKECINRSCQIASISVLNLGTQSSFPVRDSLPDELFS